MMSNWFDIPLLLAHAHMPWSLLFDVLIFGAVVTFSARNLPELRTYLRTLASTGTGGRVLATLAVVALVGVPLGMIVRMVTKAVGLSTLPWWIPSALAACSLAAAMFYGILYPYLQERRR